MKQRFLPIGTILMLKGGTKEVMITSYCVFSQGAAKQKDGEKKMYEYGGCPYPEGILDSNMALAFNHNQIEKIVHMGYESKKQEELSKKLDEQYATVKEKFEKGELV